MPVRDADSLESALACPRVSALGADADETLVERAAALTRLLVCNRGLIDVNERLGLAALTAFLRING